MAQGDVRNHDGTSSAYVDRVKAAELAAQVFAGQGFDATGDRLVALMIIFECYISEGADLACERLGWKIDIEPAPVISLIDRMRSTRPSEPAA